MFFSAAIGIAALLSLIAIWAPARDQGQGLGSGRHDAVSRPLVYVQMTGLLAKPKTRRIRLARTRR